MRTWGHATLNLFRWTRLAVGLVLPLLVLMACGADAGPEAIDDAPTAEEPEPDEPEADEPDPDEPDPDEPDPDDPDDPTARFSGETMNLIVPYGPGGGYDLNLRSFAPHLEAAGDLTAVVDNRPGAGGLQAVNELFAAAGDPTQIVSANGPGMVSAWLADAEGVRFELSEFTYLGRMNAEVHVLGVSGDSDIESFDELLEAGTFSYGVTGPGSAALIHATVLADTFDLDINLVSGFDGITEIITALIRGDIDVMSIEPSGVEATIPPGEFKPLVYLGEGRSEFLPDVPELGEFELTDRQRELLDAHVAMFSVGRAMIAPPGLDEADAAALRELVETALSDPQFIADMEETGFPVEFATAEETAALVEAVAAAPQEYVSLLSDAYR